MTKALRDKIIESLTSIIPIALIIIILSMTFTPLDTGTFVLFTVGVVLLIVGMGCFTLGADMSMLVIGEKIGSTLTHSRKIWLIARYYRYDCRTRLADPCRTGPRRCGAHAARELFADFYRCGGRRYFSLNCHAPHRVQD